MIKTVKPEYVGKWAIYLGKNRKDVFGDAAWQVVDQRSNGQYVAFLIDNKYEWVHIDSVELISNDITADVDAIFTAAVGGKYEQAKAELARLEARVAELRKAIEVMDSL